MVRLTGNELIAPSYNASVETPGVSNGVTDLGVFSTRREALDAYEAWLRKQPNPRAARKQRRYILRAED